MSLELILDPHDYQIAQAQLRDKPSLNAPLSATCTDVFLDVLRRNDPSIAHLRTEYYAPSADIDPYQITISAFKSAPTKTKLFIPLVIQGYKSLNKDSNPTSFIQNVIYYVKMLAHFLRGGCVEDHIVMISVIKNNNASYQLEYYDPKGRDSSNSQIIRYSQNTQNTKKVINTVQTALGAGNVELVYHNQGRFSANQSIFNGVDCGYLVIRRWAQIAGLKNFDKTTIITIASRALTLIQDTPPS